MKAAFEGIMWQETSLSRQFSKMLYLQFYFVELVKQNEKSGEWKKDSCIFFFHSRGKMLS